MDAHDGRVFSRLATALAEGHHLLLDVEESGNCYRVRADEGVKVGDALIDELALLVGPTNLSFTRM